MLTYKIIEKKDDIYKYIYFPYGRDVKVQGGQIQVNVHTKEYLILSVAQLDEREEISSSEKEQIRSHIVQLRTSQGYPATSDEEFENMIIEYKFVSKLIAEIFDQIDKGDIKDKGIVL